MLNWICFASASSFLVKTCLLPSCLFGFTFPICVVPLHWVYWGGFLLVSCKSWKTTWKWLPSRCWADVKSIDFSIPLTVVVARAWLLLFSQLSGPDSNTYVSEISLQVPSQSELRQKLCSLSSTCTDSASQDASEGESPVVQSDEEEVQVDTALAAVTERKGASDGSDESDSQTIWILKSYPLKMTSEWMNKWMKSLPV